MDSIAPLVASELMIPFKLFEADWDKHGKPAGIMRSIEMAEYADALLLFWDGDSLGSSNMRREMVRRSKPIYEVIVCSRRN